MAYVFTDVIPSFVDNTTMKLGTIDGEPDVYEITPIDGYVLHDKRYDVPVLDMVTFEPTGEYTLGFRRSSAGVGYNYDWDTNPYEFYALPENEVPADQIFSSGNGNHEVM